MDFVLSLSHFCELHGPTTILCTQLAPITCISCFPNVLTPPIDEFIPVSPTLPSEHNILSSPYASPPGSPRSPLAAFNPYFGNATKTATTAAATTASKRLNIAADTDKIPCDNCAFHVPNSTASPPVLRSHQKVSGFGNFSTVTLRDKREEAMEREEVEEDDDEHEEEKSDYLHPPVHVMSTSPTPSNLSASSGTSSSNHLMQSSYLTHTHNLTYVTRRSPEVQSLYSRLKHSCLRTLSCESLPRGSTAGPMLFGDPIAGYTVSYQFRIPDSKARGGRRTYALQALTSDCSRATKAFTNLTKAFEAIATAILSSALQSIERESSGFSSQPSSIDLAQTFGLSSSLPVSDMLRDSSKADQKQSQSTTNSPVSPTSKNLMDVSSFLTAKRLDPDGHSRSSRDVSKGKGLHELVGKDQFFLELHAKFVVILYNLVSGLR